MCSKLSTFYGIVGNIMSKRTTSYTTIAIISFTFFLAGMWYLNSPLITMAEKEDPPTIVESLPVPIGKSVLINLNSGQVLLKDGLITKATLQLVSQGKPGSYYETIGGKYYSDYKEISHFSSIGHVYMPYSIHIFGNYFIHGIPYYPNGEKVSSAYSGGCIRLTDIDAKRVYDFISTSTPIIITRIDEKSFEPTVGTTTIIKSMNMTRLMIATISLEFLTQENKILDTDDISYTTRKNTLNRLLVNGDSKVSSLYAQDTGVELFISYMNKKAEAIGLTNTMFNGIYSPAITTDKDYERFMSYIMTYKSYLVTQTGDRW